MVDHLKRVRAARRARERAERRLINEATAAFDAGYSLREIAAAAGLTHVTIWRWLGESDQPQIKARRRGTSRAQTTSEVPDAVQPA